jgi:L-alanine-DL-glutamate epimerase-like enolase superfamily enzyme
MSGVRLRGAPVAGAATTVEYRRMPKLTLSHTSASPPAPVALADTFSRLDGLDIEIDGYELVPHSLYLAPWFTRHTTVVRLFGGGLVGEGEDTTYAPEDQLSFQTAGADLPVSGRWNIASFSAHLEHLSLFPTGPSHLDYAAFRRWAFESAALDLALRQAGRSLADILKREPRPVSFVVSPGPENSIDPTHDRLTRYPTMRLKVMPTLDWDDQIARELAATGAVDIVDMKGQYDETVPIALPAEPGLYRRVLDAFPNAWLEDPALTAETEPLLRRHRDQITWDAPIRSVTSIRQLAFKPRMLNMKPSRFGSLRALLDAYDYCDRNGIGTYGGGQFELGPGRAQIQLLASLFHPHAPNDVAPGAYNEPEILNGLPTSPLPAPARSAGFH